MEIEYRGRRFTLTRYPPTTNSSLLPVSAADLLQLQWLETKRKPGEAVTVIHDRFGAVAACLENPLNFVLTYHSQGKALAQNRPHPSTIIELGEPVPPARLAVMSIPKSLTLFETYLRELGGVAAADFVLAAGFMTRRFTPRLLEIAGRYAGSIAQSRAWRKARLLHLTDFKFPLPPAPPPARLVYGGRTYRQLPGVFSAGRVDPATRWLLDAWDERVAPRVGEPSLTVDLACGNGIIGDQLLQRYPEMKLVAIDDFLPAVRAAQLNLPPERSRVLHDHRMDRVADSSVDLVVTNPPYHFGHETSIEVSLELFAQSHRVLRPGAHLVVVANRHLNYGTHLRRRFDRVERVGASGKYEIWLAGKEGDDV